MAIGTGEDRPVCGRMRHDGAGEELAGCGVEGIDQGEDGVEIGADDEVVFEVASSTGLDEAEGALGFLVMALSAGALEGGVDEGGELAIAFDGDGRWEVENDGNTAGIRRAAVLVAEFLDDVGVECGGSVIRAGGLFGRSALERGIGRSTGSHLGFGLDHEHHGLGLGQAGAEFQDEFEFVAGLVIEAVGDAPLGELESFVGVAFGDERLFEVVDFVEV